MSNRAPRRTWRNALQSSLRCSPPGPDWLTIEAVGKRLDLGRERTRIVVRQMVADGLVEQIKGNRVTNGRRTRCLYYRLAPVRK